MEIRWRTIIFYSQVTGKLTALKGLDARLREIRGYLDLVIDGKLPLNHEILYHLQVWFILLSVYYCTLQVLISFILDFSSNILFFMLDYSTFSCSSMK